MIRGSPFKVHVYTDHKASVSIVNVGDSKQTSRILG